VKLRPSVFLKIGMLIFGVSLLLWTCRKERNPLDSKQPQEWSFSSVEKTIAKEVFESHVRKQERYLKGLSSKKNNALQIKPNWSTFKQEDLSFTDALLSAVDVETNAATPLDTRIIFLSVNDKILRLLESKQIVELDGNELNESYLYYHNLNGKFIVAFKVENERITEKLVAKKTLSETGVFNFSSFFYGFNSGCYEDLNPKTDFCTDSFEPVFSDSTRSTVEKSALYWLIFGNAGLNYSVSSWWDRANDCDVGGDKGDNYFMFYADSITSGEGGKPIEEYDDKCAGVCRLWELSLETGNEYFAVLTLDSALLITQQLSPHGGGITGLYNYNGTTYYQYLISWGSPARTYTGQFSRVNRYFITIVATIHTHPLCVNDGTDGITNFILKRDQKFAAAYPNVNHYIVGCGAIGQLSGNSSKAFNIQSGNLDTLCNNLR
jgi:hypothetical protein